MAAQNETVTVFFDKETNEEKVVKLLWAQAGLKDVYCWRNLLMARQIACLPSEETKAKARKRRKAKAKNAKRNSR